MVSRSSVQLKVIDMENGDAITIIKHDDNEFEVIDLDDQPARGKHARKED